MKGIVFTEFLDFVDARYGADMVDDIIEDASPANGGAYTSAGAYSFEEMGALVGALATRTGVPAPDLIRAFGARLCQRFVVKFPVFFDAETCLFDFLESIDGHIHVEVRKLYPDAEPPRFHVRSRSARSIDIDYASCRPLEALAEGMILAAAEHYGETVDVVRTRVCAPEGDMTRFSISRAADAMAA